MYIIIILFFSVCTVVILCSYTLWTQWKIKGNDKMTLKQFLEVVKVHSKCYRPHSIPFSLFSVQSEYGVEPTMVVLGVKMIYAPIMPGHRKRLPQT